MSLAAGERIELAPELAARPVRIGRDWIALIAMAVALTLAMLASVTKGRYDLPLSAIIDLVLGRDIADPVATAVFWQVRAPRVLAAVMVGGAMAIPGAAYQGILKNPMASSEIVGATSGAAFGVALGIILELNIVAIQFLAFGCGLLAVMMTLAVTAVISRGQDSLLILVLVGIMVGSIFTSMVSAIKFLSDPYSKLPAITFWLMGSLSAITKHDVAFIWKPLLTGMIPLMLVRWRINVLALGDDEARALGVNTFRIRALIIVCATMMTASSVAIAGQVGGMGMGGVGLVVPHLTRFIVGPNYRVLLPATALMGGLYLLLMDDLARTISATELPLGILTSLVGAPFFVVLLLRARKGWA